MGQWSGKMRNVVLVTVLATLATSIGCRGRQHAHVLSHSDKDMVGSHEAGAETWKPLIDEAVVKLMERSANSVKTVSYQRPDGLPVRNRFALLVLRIEAARRLAISTSRSMNISIH